MARGGRRVGSGRKPGPRTGIVLGMDGWRGSSWTAFGKAAEKEIS